MTSLTRVIQNHLEYDAWANARLLDAAEKLTSEDLEHDFGSADKSVHGTLTHLFRSSRTWLARVEEGPDAIAQRIAEDDDWPALRAKWTDLEQRWKEWGCRLSEGDALQSVEYTDLRGNLWKQPLWEVILHVVNHGTHHRGQVSGFLRASGTAPPNLDFISFIRQQRPR